MGSAEEHIPGVANSEGPTSASVVGAPLSRRSRWGLGLLFAAGLLTSLAAWYLVQSQAEEQLRRSLHHSGMERHLVIEREVVIVQESLKALRGYVHASEYVSAEEFSIFAKSLFERQHGLRALEWIPRVLDDDLPGYQESVRAEGPDQYLVWERGGDGARAPARGRREYFPVHYVEPLAGNEAALGFDLGSNPRRRDALEEARDTGQPVSTAPIVLVQDEDKIPSVLIFLPVYRKANTPSSLTARRDELLGFALGVVCVADLVEQALEGFTQGRVDISVFDTTDAKKAGAVLLYRSDAIGREVGATASDGLQQPRPQFSHEFEVGGRRWRMTAIATERLSEPLFSWGPRAVLGGGVFVTLLVLFIFSAIMRRNASITSALRSLEEEILERRRAEEARIRLEDQLRQAQKMEALGTLAGGIAHDFNNVLTGITLNAELLASGADEGSAHAEQVGDILQATVHARSLVEGILAFSRQMESELNPTDLHDALSLGTRMLERTMPRMIELQTHLNAQHSVIRGDPNQLTQLLINLGSNAKDAMPGGGQLSISTEDVVLEPGHEAGPSEPGAYVRLTVSDTGEGMAPDTLERIFDPFFTMKDVGRGTGLGLSIVYGIVQSHGGHISSISAPGAGTTFHVLFPRVDDRSPSSAPPRPELDPGKGGPERVLVVDDEELLLKLTTKILEKAGYVVQTAASGEEALAIFEAAPEDFDVVILDVSMPGMGGQRCFEKMLEIHSNARVIISSGYALDGKMQDTLDLGAKGFLPKPFKRQEILATVRDALAS